MPSFPDSNSANLPTALDGVTGPPEEAKEETKSRFRTAGDAYNAYKELRQGDQLSAMNRIRYQMKLDGEPPYSKAEMKKYNLATNANVNMGLMEDALNAASAPYEDLVDGSEVLCRLPTKYGAEMVELREGWQQVMEEEFTALIVNDDGFDYQLAELVRQFNLHGIAVPFFESKQGITWTTTETGNFLLPRDVRASTKSLDLCCCVRDYMPHELWAMIENREVAEENGWDIKETMSAIKAATPNVQWDDDWDKWTEQWKNNDLGMTYTGKPSVIRVVHMWAVARNGKGNVGFMMFKADGSAKEFMFKNDDMYDALGESLTIFTDGVGTNGKYHGIRGIGYKLYAIIKELDELWSSLIDAIRQSGKIFIQPKSEGGAKNLALVEWGNFLMLPPNANFLDRALPNYAQNIIPGMNLLNQLLQGKTGQYTTQGALDSTKEQTAKEFMGKLDQIAKLSTTKVKIFYSAWERLVREQVRRVMRKDWHKSDPDYYRVKDFYDRCEERGVPKEAIHKINLQHVKVVRAMGGGSPEARMAMYERLFALYGYYDAEGQQRLVRGATMAYGGKEQADSLAPMKAGQRPPVDKKIADLENGQMSQMMPQAVEPNELHAVHLTEHLTGPNGLLQDVQAFKAGQIGYEAIPSMRLKHTHCQGNEETGEIGHMQFIPDKMPDGTPNMQKASFKEALQQTEESITNGEKHLDAERRKQEKAAAEGQPDEMGFTQNRSVQQAEESLLKVQSEAQAKEALTQQELDHRERRFQQESDIKRRQAEEDARLKQAQVDMDITSKALKDLQKPVAA